MEYIVPNGKELGISDEESFNIHLAIGSKFGYLIRQDNGMLCIRFGELDFEFDPPELSPLIRAPNLVVEYDTPLAGISDDFHKWNTIMRSELSRIRLLGDRTQIRINYNSHTSFPFTLVSEEADTQLMAEYSQDYVWSGDFFRGFNPCEDCCLFQKLLVLKKVKKESLESSITSLLLKRLNKEDITEYRNRMKKYL